MVAVGFNPRKIGRHMFFVAERRLTVAGRFNARKTGRRAFFVAKRRLTVAGRFNARKHRPPVAPAA